MAEVATKKRTTPRKGAAEKKSDIAAGLSRRHIVIEDEVWNDMNEICPKLPFSPSVTKYIAQVLKEAVARDKKKLEEKE